MLKDLKTQNFIVANDGVLYYYDDSRDKWISDADTILFSLNHRKIRGPRYFKTGGGVVTYNSGYRIQRNAVVTGVTVQFKASASGTFQILVLRGLVETLIYQFSVTGEKGKKFVTDYDLNEDDVLKVKIISGQVDFPVIGVEIAWRTT